MTCISGQIVTFRFDPYIRTILICKEVEVTPTHLERICLIDLDLGIGRDSEMTRHQKEQQKIFSSEEGREEEEEGQGRGRKRKKKKRGK